MSKRKVVLLQQGVWDMPVQSLPLAAGYLKASVLARPELASEFDVEICSFKGGERPQGMVRRVLFDAVPDVLGCSVFGWNFRSFGALSETFRQCNPTGWVIWGGTHVAHQAARTMANFPSVDVVVNGEGEQVFVELLQARASGADVRELGHIAGISYRGHDGTLHTTPDRPRIAALDEIPSPFLTGAVDLFDRDGAFLYDVVLMETTRGCPYQCSFCWWGGAIGTKVRRFSRDRLLAELDLFGRNQLPNLVLCDANFGMLPEDAEFLEDLIRVRERHGFPRHLETSWAKNKSKVFYDILHRMRRAGLRSSFTLALQSLDTDTLDSMQRRNMRLNDWEDLTVALHREGFDCYAELIWGAPGETPASFLQGYDRLAQKVSRVAVYPLLLLPNTAYSAQRDRHELVTLRSDADDYEYVLSHRTMSLEDNARVLRFVFWARILGENMVLRHLWGPLRRLEGMTHSGVLDRLDRWIDAQPDALARAFRACRAEMVEAFDGSRIESGLRLVYTAHGVDALFLRWWAEDILPLCAASHRALLAELLRYDLATRPLYARSDEIDLPVVQIAGESYYERPPTTFAYDFAAIAQAMRDDAPIDLQERPTEVQLLFKTGFARYIDNHEFVKQFVGRTREEIESTQVRSWAPSPDPGDARSPQDSHRS